jgi:hypothetical protein
MKEILKRDGNSMRNRLERMVISSKFLLRRLSSKIRTLPSFIIIGTQRGGTTSFYKYLVAHPQIASAFLKEVHYFDHNHEKGMRWYKSHFPTLLYYYFKRLLTKKNMIAGESSPYYLLHPHAPRRILKVLPNVKIIVLLRNPIDRALSHYNHEVKNKRENLSFEQAISSEDERINGELDKMLRNEKYVSTPLLRHSYILRGFYSKQIKNWFTHFPKNNFLFIKSENFYDNPAETMDLAFEFLGVDSFHNNNYEVHNNLTYNPMSKQLRLKLKDIFESHNKSLSELLGNQFMWE